MAVYQQIEDADDFFLSQHTYVHLLTTVELFLNCVMMSKFTWRRSCCCTL